jgi:hypothetical protein
MGSIDTLNEWLDHGHRRPRRTRGYKGRHRKHQHRLITMWLGAAAAAACAAAAIASPPAQAAAARHARITWGVNRGDETPFNAAIPRAHAVRTYYDTPNKFPSVWPRTAGPGIWQLISIRPGPWMLFHHRYDAKIRSLAATAPPHAELTIWHENGPADPLGYPPSVNNPRTAVRMQEYVQRLVRGTPVRFGAIICAPAGQVENWIAPGLDWYGVDLYLGPNTAWPSGAPDKAKIWQRLDQNLAVFRQLSGRRYPALRIPETNAGWDRYRQAWFTDLASWFASHDGHRQAWILTFWKDGKTGRQGGLGGPWPPSDPVVDTLRRLAARYA